MCVCVCVCVCVANALKHRTSQKGEQPLSLANTAMLQTEVRSSGFSKVRKKKEK